LLSDSIYARDLSRVLVVLPDAVIEKHPRLAFARARALAMAGERTAAMEWCTVAIGSARDDLPLLARAVWEFGCIALADNQVALAEVTLELGRSAAEAAGVSAPDLFHLNALLAERRSARSAALADYRKAILFADRALTSVTRVLALRNLASALTHVDPRSAVGMCALAAALVDGDGLDPRVGPAVENVFAYALICDANPRAGRNRAASAASRARDLGHLLVEHYARFNECVAIELLGDATLARRSLSSLNEVVLPTMFPELSDWIRLRLAWLALKTDDVDAAVAETQRLSGFADTTVLRSSVATMRAILDFRLGHAARATASLQRIIEEYVQSEDWLTTFALLLWVARCHDQLGEGTAAAAAVTAALQIGRSRGFRLSPNWWSIDLAGIANALAAPADREYAALLVASSGSVGPSAAPGVVVTDEGAVRIAGNLLPDGTWRVGRTGSGMLRRIFRCLVAAHPVGLSRDEMADLLWPDTEGDRAIRNLYAALNDLRRVLTEIPGLGVGLERGRYRLLAAPSIQFQIELPK
jgi:tetratricopeptide (TPR) repeat protein